MQLMTDMHYVYHCVKLKRVFSLKTMSDQELSNFRGRRGSCAKFIKGSHLMCDQDYALDIVHRDPIGKKELEVAEEKSSDLKEN